MITDKIQKQVDLFPHNTLRMRTVAEEFVVVMTRDELMEAISYAKEKGIPFFVIGGGSNIALARQELQGLVIKNLYMKTEIVTETEASVDLRVSSGYPVTKLINECAEKGYSGLEYHLGLPGTVGGALYMNSKWTNPVCYFGDPLVSATLITPEGQIKEVDRDYFEFAYDYSTIQKTKEIVLDAVFRLKKVAPAEVAQHAKDAQEYRKKTQPHGVASSGCFFQNITKEEMEKIGVPTQSAGNLIDKSGLKGLRLGGFVVSADHANFVINTGEGKPDDLVKLLALMKEKVKEKFGITLREEVVVKQ